MGEQKSMPSYFVHVSSVPVQGRSLISGLGKASAEETTPSKCQAVNSLEEAPAREGP